MLSEMAVQAVDRQVELAVRIPADAKVCFLERAVTGLRRLPVPSQPLRLVEPEAVRICTRQVLELGELGWADAGVEMLGDWMDRFAHRPRLISMTKR